MVGTALVKLGATGEDVLDKAAGGTSRLDRGTLLLWLWWLWWWCRLLVLVLVSKRLLSLWVGQRDPGEVLVTSTVGGVELDRGGDLVVSLRLGSGDGVHKLGCSLADLCVRDGSAGIQWMKLVQLGLGLVGAVVGGRVARTRRVEMRWRQLLIWIGRP